MEKEKLAAELFRYGATSLAHNIYEHGIEAYATSAPEVAILSKTYRRRLRNHPEGSPARLTLERCLAALGRVDSDTVVMAHVKSCDGDDAVVILDDQEREVLCVFAVRPVER